MKKLCQFGVILILTISSCLAHTINNDFKCAEALWEEYDFENAIVSYKKAISSGELTDDELATSYYNIATFFFLCFKAEDSIKSTNEVLRLQPYNTKAISLRALAEDFLGRDEQALADWAKLLALNPKDSSVYNDRSYFYSSRGQLEKAIADMEMYLKLQPNSPEQLWELGNLKKRQAPQFKKDEKLNNF
jgi:tetratricopeptide (TPR) repeat protein